MDTLINQLEKNPIVVLVMFLISVFSGIMGLIVGWRDFYKNYLSKEVAIPLWMILLVAFVGALFYLAYSKVPKSTKELEVVNSKSFGVQRVEMDGKNFVNCKFDGSELVFRGIDGFSLVGNNFITPPRIRLVDHAGTTMTVMKALHSDPNFRPYVEKALSEDSIVLPPDEE